MSEPWFVESGAAGELRVREVDGDWVVVSDECANMVKCHFSEDVGLEAESGEKMVEVAVSKYVRGTGDRTSHLFVTVPDDGDSVSKDPTLTDGQSDEAATVQAEQENCGSAIDGSEQNNSCSSDSDEGRSLDELQGDGEYISVVATVDRIQWVKKDESGVPDIKGELIDESCQFGVPFVVREGVSHPYLEEGTQFLFRNVKDYYYSKRDEVQVVITEYTDFEKRGEGTSKTSTNEGPGSSGARSSGSKKSARSRSSEKSLHKIAKEKLGDETFTVEQDDASLVGDARRKAKNQQRDPAIDPRLQENYNSDNDEES